MHIKITPALKVVEDFDSNINSVLSLSPLTV